MTRFIICTCTWCSPNLATSDPPFITKMDTHCPRHRELSDYQYARAAEDARRRRDALEECP
jgi:hypothetical protein